MTNLLSIELPKLKVSKYLTLFAILFTTCLVTSCSDDDPEEAVEPETFVYLVTLNEDPDLKSLTIVDSLNGAGSMVVPDIPAHVSSNFDLIIDRVNENRANISASQQNSLNLLAVTGAGFFTADSVYLELTIDGFTNRDILTGNR